MTRTKSNAFSDMLADEPKSRTILNILEQDWPTALSVIPIAMKHVGEESSKPECVAVLNASLDAYYKSLGRPDMQRLAAFMDTFIEGVTGLLKQEPTPEPALLELSEIIDQCSTDQQMRSKVEAMLIPHGTSLWKVWKGIRGARRG